MRILGLKEGLEFKTSIRFPAVSHFPGLLQHGSSKLRIVYRSSSIESIEESVETEGVRNLIADIRAAFDNVLFV